MLGLGVLGEAVAPLAADAGFAVVVVLFPIACSSRFAVAQDILAFVALVVLNALLLRVVLAAREAAGRQFQSPTFAVL